MNDQATALRAAIRRAGTSGTFVPAVEATPPRPPVDRARIAESRTPERPRPATVTPPRLARAIAISSGKGGVGKSNLAVNLAVAMSNLGQRVCLVDADLGMANADVLCNLTPAHTLEHVMTGRCTLARAAVLAPGGFRLIPGASGVPRIADMGNRSRSALLGQLARLEQLADVLLIDTGAGISANVLGFAAAAHTQVVITTPEPTALTDCYGLIKALRRRCPAAHVEVVVNQARSRGEAEEVFSRIDRVSRSFLRLEVGYAGAIPADPAVPEAVHLRVPFVLSAPGAPATAAVGAMARRLAGLPAVGDSAGGFFARLVRAFVRERGESDRNAQRSL